MGGAVVVFYQWWVAEGVGVVVSYVNTVMYKREQSLACHAKHGNGLYDDARSPFP